VSLLTQVFFGNGDGGEEIIVVSILILDSDQVVAAELAEQVKALGHQATVATSMEQARDAVLAEDFDGFVVEPQMSNGVYAGLDFVDELLFDGVPRHRIVTLTGVHMVELARQCAQMRIAMRIKPMEEEGLGLMLERWGKKTAADKARDEVI
jgi:CheY-like chemotaxis protein